MNNYYCQEVYRLRRSPFPLVLKYLFFLAPAFILLYLLDIANRISGNILLKDRRILYGIFFIWAILIGLEMIRRYFNDLYIFGHRRIIHLSGCLSLNMRKSSIHYSDIKEVYLQQSLFARIARYGTLKFGTAGTEILEITFKDIPLPTRISRYVQDFISSTRRRDSERKIDNLFFALTHEGHLSP